MQSVDLMIFDFDGTLVNSGYDIAASVNYTLSTLGLPVKRLDTILSHIGDGVQALIQKSLVSGFHHFYDEAMLIFTDHYTEHMLDTTCLYDSVIDVLKYFPQKAKVILTNKRKFFTVEMSKRFQIEGYFDDIIGADSTPYKKPDKRLLPPLLEKYHSVPAKTVVIGDGINDILLAKNSGVQSCALLNGLTRRDILLSMNPDFCCEDIRELKNIFQ
jgi:phosphoglycolate phosphatase